MNLSPYKVVFSHHFGISERDAPFYCSSIGKYCQQMVPTIMVASILIIRIEAKPLLMLPPLLAG